jgi:hypothetical protein
MSDEDEGGWAVSAPAAAKAKDLRRLAASVRALTGDAATWSDAAVAATAARKPSPALPPPSSPAVYSRPRPPGVPFDKTSPKGNAHHVADTGSTKKRRCGLSLLSPAERALPDGPRLLYVVDVLLQACVQDIKARRWGVGDLSPPTAKTAVTVASRFATPRLAEPRPVATSLSHHERTGMLAAALDVAAIWAKYLALVKGGEAAGFNVVPYLRHVETFGRVVVPYLAKWGPGGTAWVEDDGAAGGGAGAATATTAATLAPASPGVDVVPWPDLDG